MEGLSVSTYGKPDQTSTLPELSPSRQQLEQPRGNLNPQRAEANDYL